MVLTSNSTFYEHDKISLFGYLTTASISTIDSNGIPPMYFNN